MITVTGSADPGHQGAVMMGVPCWPLRSGHPAAAVLAATRGASGFGRPRTLASAAALTALSAPPPHLPSAGFDGMLVAAVGVVLTGGGWLLLLLAGRRHRRGRMR